jgi:hypothetical protein
MSSEMLAAGLVGAGHAGSGGALVMLAVVVAIGLVALVVSRRRR